STFDEYLENLRSDYRNKLKKIIKKTKNYTIQVKKIDNFTEKHYALYEKTFERSSFPLEKLPFKFFSEFPEQAEIIEVIDEEQKLIGFAYILIQKEKYYFLFGGTENKDKFPELYARLLIEILRHGINASCSEISFGQTAENIKLKLGCIIEPRFAGLWIRSKFLRKITSTIISHISYKYDIPEYRVYKKQ
ncbi:GNAT family N-acetyltransferase, partial [bacterium]|nr:GNAT family N-acetyltransferase [bacterium]